MASVMSDNGLPMVSLMPAQSVTDLELDATAAPSSPGAGAAAGASPNTADTAADADPPSGPASSAAPSPPRTRCQRARPWLAALGFVVVLGGLAALTATGYTQALVDEVGKLGPVGGNVVFVALLVFTGLPFGWGFAVVLTSVGYLYGWYGMATNEGGAFLGAMAGFAFSRWGCRGWVQRQIGRLSPKRRRQAKVLTTGVLRGRAGVLFLASLRVTPVFAFGWINGIAGAATDMSIYLYALSTVLGMQVDVVIYTNAGRVLRLATNAARLLLAGGGVNNGTSAANGTLAGGEDDGSNAMLIVQIVVSVLLVVGATLYGRFLLKRAMAKADDADDADDAGKVGGTR